MLIEEGYFYNDDELQELLDSDEITIVPVVIHNEFTEEKERIVCLIDYDLDKFYLEQYTDNEYHYAVLLYDSTIVEDLTAGTTIQIMFNENGIAVCTE